MSEDGKVELKDFSDLELVAKIKQEEDEDKWNLYLEELVNRELFKLIEKDTLERISKAVKL